MPSITADGIEINVENDQWRLFNLSGANSLTPFFFALRGEGLLRYASAFGETRGLPGNILAVDYVKAVVVGFDERLKRWTLGLHVAMKEEDKPRFVELAHWPSDSAPQYAIDSHTAGRVLAEYISCPLKLFGVKKTAQAGDAARTTVTGPLIPHQREDMDLAAVRYQATQVDLPLTLGDIWLGQGGGGILLRLPRESTRSKAADELPAYQQIVFDKNGQTVKLVPQTGLLGTFFGSTGRAVKFTQIRNVEMRHTVTMESSLKQSTDGLAEDVTQTHHVFGIYLTLTDESLLVMRSEHTTTSDLQRRRFKINTALLRDQGNGVKAAEDMVYMREHQKDAWKYEKARFFTEQAAYVIASAVDRPLVKTTVGDPI